MKGGRQGQGCQTRRSPSRSEDGHVQAALVADALGCPQAAEEVDISGAAIEDDVLAVVDLDARVRLGKGVGLAAGEGALLQQCDVESAIRELAGGGQAR